MIIKLELEYDGKGFSGWQEQPGLITVQGELQRSLMIYLKSLSKKTSITIPKRIVVEGSGRTDAGVHARSQVAAFKWPESLDLDLVELKRALNGITSPSLSVVNLNIEKGNFHPRHSPHIKQYRYRISLNRGSRGLDDSRAWYIPGNLNIPLMIDSAHLFKGTHDFQAFRASDCSAPSTQRTIQISEVVRTGAHELSYIVQGKGFLKQMVRIIVGTLVEVGREKLTKSQVKEILLSRDRRNAGPTAPAHGLTLWSVWYT